MLSVYRKFFNKYFIEEHTALKQELNRANKHVFKLGGALRGAILFVIFTTALSIMTMAGVLHPQQFLAILILPTFFSLMLAFLTSDPMTWPGYCDRFVMKRLKSYTRAKEALRAKEAEFLTLTFYDNPDYTYEFVAFVEQLIEGEMVKALKQEDAGKKAFNNLGELKDTLKYFKINYVEHNHESLIQGYFKLYQGTKDFGRSNCALDAFEAEFKKSNARERVILAINESEESKKEVINDKITRPFESVFTEHSAEKEIGHTDYKHSL